MPLTFGRPTPPLTCVIDGRTRPVIAMGRPAGVLPQTQSAGCFNGPALCPLTARAGPFLFLSA